MFRIKVQILYELQFGFRNNYTIINYRYSRMNQGCFRQTREEYIWTWLITLIILFFFNNFFDNEKRIPRHFWNGHWWSKMLTLLNQTYKQTMAFLFCFTLPYIFWHILVNNHTCYIFYVYFVYGWTLLCGLVWFYAYQCNICLPISANGLWEWLMILTLFARLT